MILWTENKAEPLRMPEIDKGGQEREVRRVMEVQAGCLRTQRVNDEGGAGEEGWESGSWVRAWTLKMLIILLVVIMSSKLSHFLSVISQTRL